MKTWCFTLENRMYTRITCKKSDDVPSVESNRFLLVFFFYWKKICLQKFMLKQFTQLYNTECLSKGEGKTHFYLVLILQFSSRIRWCIQFFSSKIPFSLYWYSMTLYGECFMAKKVAVFHWIKNCKQSICTKLAELTWRR